MGRPAVSGGIFRNGPPGCGGLRAFSACETLDGPWEKRAFHMLLLSTIHTCQKKGKSQTGLEICLFIKAAKALLDRRRRCWKNL
jgi:hypothetical protein